MICFYSKNIRDTERRILNSNIQDQASLEKNQRLKAVNYFLKKPHRRCLPGF